MAKILLFVLIFQVQLKNYLGDQILTSSSNPLKGLETTTRSLNELTTPAFEPVTAPTKNTSANETAKVVGTSTVAPEMIPKDIPSVAPAKVKGKCNSRKNRFSSKCKTANVTDGKLSEEIVPTTTMKNLRKHFPVPAHSPKKTSKDHIHIVGSNHRNKSQNRRLKPMSTKNRSLVTDEEISQISEQMFAEETSSVLNRLNLDLQSRTKCAKIKDEAPSPLFNPDKESLWSNSIEKMMKLFNNYEVDTSLKENITEEEKKEENDFLDSIMASGVMRHAMWFLEKKGFVSSDPINQTELVRTLWFSTYSRSHGKLGSSSSFEHVFLNEIKNGNLIGFHNWVYFMEQEKRGKVNYMGYSRKVNLGKKAIILETRFTYKGVGKMLRSLFIGTSPELEIALYTLCFHIRPDKSCHVTLGGQKVNVVTHTLKSRGHKFIGSTNLSVHIKDDRKRFKVPSKEEEA